MAKPLENLMLTTIETIVEGVEKEPWTAFINNAASYTGVMLNYKGLVKDIAEVREEPSKLLAMEEQAIKKFGKNYENSLVSNIFKLIWSAVVYNISTTISIAELIEEHNSQPREIVLKD